MAEDNDFTLHIGGEATKRHTIPVDMLADIGKSLQELLQKIACYDLPSDQPIDQANFKIELSKFKGGSATPTFVFTENVNHPPVGGIGEQRNGVTEKFYDIMKLANVGDYMKLREIYREPIKRNEIVNSVYGFVTSFKNAPVEVVTKNKAKPYSIKKFKTSVRDAMITEVRASKSGDKEKSEQFAKVRVTREKGKNKVISHTVLEIFDKKLGVDYSTDTIVANGTVYELAFQLHCKVDVDGGCTKIESDMLGIFGHGVNLDEAEKEFNEEFDYIYKRYNELSDKKLSKDVQEIKKRLNLLVKKVSI